MPFELDGVKFLVVALHLASAVGDRNWSENERMIFTRASGLIRNTSYDEKSCSIYPVSSETSETALTSSARDLVISTLYNLELTVTMMGNMLGLDLFANFEG